MRIHSAKIIIRSQIIMVFSISGSTNTSSWIFLKIHCTWIWTIIMRLLFSQFTCGIECKKKGFFSSHYYLVINVNWHSFFDNISDACILHTLLCNVHYYTYSWTLKRIYTYKLSDSKASIPTQWMCDWKWKIDLSSLFFSLSLLMYFASVSFILRFILWIIVWSLTESIFSIYIIDAVICI